MAAFSRINRDGTTRARRLLRKVIYDGRPPLPKQAVPIRTSPPRVHQSNPQKFDSNRDISCYHQRQSRGPNRFAALLAIRYTSLRASLTKIEISLSGRRTRRFLFVPFSLPLPRLNSPSPLFSTNRHRRPEIGSSGPIPHRPIGGKPPSASRGAARCGGGSRN